ncbi:LPXTG cell wall anchor domain-containing protein [Streptomyces sp. WAC05374]|nr:LPXTG cell wall anchor domain-containing protein [Streptomyces sp. WAC05374]TDF37743.1 LPXTG cell wall anchor domain-containing protein [Streptomyces sp. WAC05374]TDF44972.1 LPXTG cell wall anchor domain-containing protein [Streptomyces sp. WAC05374]TDF46268.1 LPXTG cell wall anchor domain-containing protein [Streptomyces sp. WAC05374]
MAVAAATAVIAPAAFLAAPAAYATDGTTSTTSTSGAAGETDGTTNDGTTTTEDGATTTDGGTTAEDGTQAEDGAGTTEDGTKTEDGATTEDGTGTEDDTTTGGTETGTEDGAEKPGTETGKDEEEEEAGEEEPGDIDEEMPPYCEDLDENFQEQALDVDLAGLPGKIVAGSGWEEFNLTVSNKSKAALKEVAFYAEVENYEFEDESKYLSQYVDLQFRMPDTNEWVTIGDKDWAGGYFWGVENMKPADFVKIDLRLSIDKNAPAGDSYSFGSGAYLGDVKGQECIAETGMSVDFAVLKPGSENENPGEAKPGEGKPDEKPAPDTKPQGGIKEIPVTGNLAETGSSSMLPTIGIAGGIAIVAGAGVVFALKRRSNGAAA